MCREIPNRSIQFKTFMNKILFIFHMIFAKKLRLPVVWIPPTMFDSASQEVVLTWNKVGIRLRAIIHFLPNLILDFLSRPLIRI